MHAHRLRSCEIPVRMRPRLTGESAISSTQSVYYMVKVLLAVFVGLFRRRPTVERARRRRWPRSARRDARDARARSRDRRHARRCSCSCSSSCAASTYRSATRSSGCLPRRRCSCWPSWKGLLTSLSHDVGISYPPVGPVRGRDRADRDAAAVFLAGRLAPVRPEQDPRPAPRRCCSSASSKRRTLRPSDRQRVPARRPAPPGCRTRSALGGRRRRAVKQPLRTLADRGSEALAVVVVTHESGEHLPALLAALPPSCTTAMSS